MANKKPVEKTENTESVDVGTFNQKIVEEASNTETETTQTEKTVEATEPTPNKVRIKPKFEPTEDAKQTKNIAWLAYLLFFIPLLINSKSPFVRHHANEGLEINIFDVLGLTLLLVGALVDTTNSAVNGLLLIFVLIGTGLLVLTTITKIYMIVTTLQCKKTNTPWMWNLTIIK